MNFKSILSITVKPKYFVNPTADLPVMPIRPPLRPRTHSQTPNTHCTASEKKTPAKSFNHNRLAAAAAPSKQSFSLCSEARKRFVTNRNKINEQLRRWWRPMQKAQKMRLDSSAPAKQNARAPRGRRSPGLLKFVS